MMPTSKPNEAAENNNAQQSSNNKSKRYNKNEVIEVFRQLLGTVV